MPGIVEGDDLGTYVCKFRGAGQGLRVLVAEVIVGELARRIGLDTPTQVVLDLSGPTLLATRPTRRCRTSWTASTGLNLGIDFLPGSFGYDGDDTTLAQTAAMIVWLDAFCANVDRSWRNPNLLWWGDRLWVIDHGAALYFHHAWAGGLTDPVRFAAQPWELRRPCAARPGRCSRRGRCSPVRGRDSSPAHRGRRPGARRLARAGSGRGVSRCTAGGVRRLPHRAARHAAVAAEGRGMSTPYQCPYQYIALRYVPRVDREEFVNVGVVVFCHATDYLCSAWHLDPLRLTALDAQVDLDRLGAALEVRRRCVFRRPHRGQRGPGVGQPALRLPESATQHRAPAEPGARRADR